MVVLSMPVQRSKGVYRSAVALLFFLQGICFATWASRIPSIQNQLNLSDSALGGVLFALPVGSLLSLLFAGTLVTRFGSKKVAITALLFYALVLPAIGLANSVVALMGSLVLFGIAGNVSNIAINTQAVGVESIYGRSIMASFHGLWSLAGFTAAGIGNFMIAKKVVPLPHFLGITVLMIVGVLLGFSYLLIEEKKPAAGSSKRFVKPDKALLMLGLLAFCCMICEGTMFDWSGIYFQKVVQAEEGWVGAGYTTFMCAMATGRFVADWVSNKLGFNRTVFLSGVLISCGLGVAILFPTVPLAMLGFLLVGFGVSSVVPLVYSEAGKSKTIAPGMALTAVSSIGFMGFLVGPPLIGVVAGWLSLRISFLLVALFGVAISVQMYWRKKQELQS